MANDSKKYVSLIRLSNFLDNIKEMYAQIGHKHTTADLTDYIVDTSLSSTSNNPVANSTLDAEFEAVATAMSVLETTIDGKADTAHSHTVSEVTDLQIALDNKSNIEHTHSYDDLRNKPFYEGTDYSSIFVNGTSNMNFYEWGDGVYGAAIIDAPKAFAQDVSHKVVWDGIEYTMTSAYGGNNEAGNPIVSIGAPYGDYSSYPFGVDSYQTASGTYEYSIHTNSTDVTHTIDILELGSSFVALDERFIPDTIARTVDVDTAIENVDAAIENLETVMSTKANASDLLNYYTKTEIDSMEFITVDDIDAICGDLDPSITMTSFSVTDDGQGNVVITNEGE